MQEKRFPLKIQQFIASLDPQSKNGLLISASITTIAIIFRVILFVSFPLSESVIYLPFIIALFFIGLAGIYFSVRRKPDIASYVLLASFAIYLISVTIVYEGALTALSGLFSVIGICILIFMNPRLSNFRNIVFVLVFSGLLLVVDQLWPADRVVVPEVYTRAFSFVTLFAVMSLLVYGVRQTRKAPIRGKILIAIVSVATLSGMIISLTSNYFSRQILIDEAGKGIKQIADREALAFGELLLQQVKILQTVSLNHHVTDLAIDVNNSYDSVVAETNQVQLEIIDDLWGDVSDDSELVRRILDNEVSENLNSVLNNFPENAELFVTDKYGGLIASTNKTSDFYQADEDWWQVAYNNGNGAIFIGNPEFDDSADVLAINIAVPLYAFPEHNHDDVDDVFNHEVVGIIRTTLNLSSFNDILQASNLDVGAEAITIFIDNRLVLNFDEIGSVSIEDADFDTRTIVANYFEEGAIFQRIEDGDEQRIIGLTRIQTHEDVAAIDNLDWFVIVSRAENEVLTAVDRQSQLSIFLTIITVVVSAFGATFLGQRLTKPIIELTETAQKIEKGDRLVRVNIDSEDEIGQLGNAINSMTDELDTVLNQLELRIAERTRSLQIASDVSRELSSILDLDELVTAVVNVIRDAYDFYHAQIYLWNEDKTKLILRGGTGEAGKILLSKKHFIESGKGLVGKAASSRLPVFVENVRNTSSKEVWIPNVYLSETISEAAIPIFSGNDVLGVLDIQESEMGKLSSEDVNTLQLVASQVGIAVRNAESYTRAQVRAKQDALILDINRKISATGSLESAMQVAVTELGKHLGTKTKIRLTSPKQSEPVSQEGEATTS